MMYLNYIIIAAAITHVSEEYFLGWLNWAKKFVPSVSILHFIIINALFIVLCVLAPIVLNPLYTLSLVFLLLINVFVHLIPTIVKKTFSPGLISAILFYLPISIIGFANLNTVYNFSYAQIILSVICALLVMGIPFLVQLFISIRKKPR